MTTALVTLAVDVGASDLKLVSLDLKAKDVTQPTRTATPRPATPDAVIAAIVEAAQRHRPFHRAAIGFPGIVVNGVAINAPNMDEGWVAVPLQARLASALGCPVRVANDADVAGLGVLGTEPGSGHGVELVITLGTGMGAALFVDGRLVPNFELGQHPFGDGRSYEGWLGNAGLAQTGIETWQQRLGEALALMRRTFSPSRIYLGGGNTRFLDVSKVGEGVVVVGNRPGLVGCLHLYDRYDR